MNERGISKPGILGTWAALMILLGLTWLAARYDLGAGNTIIALVISGAKMALVILLFMQVRFRSQLIWTFAAAGFVWWLIFISLAMTDYFTRKTVLPYQRAPEPQQQGRYAKPTGMG